MGRSKTRVFKLVAAIPDPQKVKLSDCGRLRFAQQSHQRMQH